MVIVLVQATKPGLPIPIDPVTVGAGVVSDGEQLVTVVVPLTVDNAGVGQIIMQWMPVVLEVMAHPVHRLACLTMHTESTMPTFAVNERRLRVGLVRRTAPSREPNGCGALGCVLRCSSQQSSAEYTENVPHVDDDRWVSDV